MKHVNTKTERVFNDTFGGLQPTKYNACVGDNGFQDTESYTRGYIEAAMTLLDGVATKEAHESNIDDIVYPISFCIRHSLELCLKGTIESLRKINNNQEIKEYKLSSTHDIGELWQFYQKHSENTDRRYLAINKKLEGHVQNIYQIDPNGQTFRYPVDLSDEKHLTKTPIISLLRLRLRFKELATLIYELNFANRHLIEEYSIGTFTKDLSRYDLYKVACQLPCIEQWKNPSFNNAKESIKAHFSISSRSLSRAINIIKDHYEFSSLVGIEKEISHLSLEAVIHYIKQWERYHNDKTTRGFNFSAKSMVYNNKLELSCINECKSQISLENFAVIHSLYELGKEHFPIYSELYPSIYESCYSDLKQAYKSGDYDREISHYFSKTPLISYIFRALQVLGQKSTVTYLKENIKIFSTLPSIDIALNFPYPCDS